MGKKTLSLWILAVTSGMSFMIDWKWNMSGIRGLVRSVYLPWQWVYLHLNEYLCVLWHNLLSGGGHKTGNSTSYACHDKIWCNVQSSGKQTEGVWYKGTQKDVHVIYLQQTNKYRRIPLIYERISQFVFDLPPSLCLIFVPLGTSIFLRGSSVNLSAYTHDATLEPVIRL
jgi:hypothetical protein